MDASKKKEFYAKNLRVGCHYYDGNTMEMVEYDGVKFNAPERFMIPLRKEVLEAMGFEPVYDEYNHEMYFQTNYGGYRLRTYPMDSMISIIDMKYLHTVVNVKAEGLNELENFMHALGLDPSSLFKYGKAVEKINAFGKQYFDYFDKWGKDLEEFMQKCEDNRKEDNG